ncbi:MAG: glycosyltransferase [Candidatus Alcyoniella australis]|nr:glycosyltransferase [Candidatus Alcyoniella australis]
MRLCLVASSYPRTPEDSINAGVFVRDCALAARDAGHRVSVVTHRKSGPSVPDPGIELVEYPWLGTETSLTSVRLNSPAGPFKAASLLTLGARALRRHIEQRGCDAVLAFWAIPGGLIARSACLPLGVPYAVWALGSDIWRYEHSRLVGPTLRRVLRDATALYADGLELAQRVEAVAGRKCAFAPSSRRLPDPDDLPNLDQSKKQLLFVGRYHPNKGPDVLLEATQLLHRELPDMRLSVFGQGELQSSLTARAARPDLDGCVEVGGFIGAQRFAAHLDQVDALVIPSRIESIPVVLSDAAQRGTPLVVTDVGDMGALVRQYSAGEVARPEDPADLARAMGEVLERGRGAYALGLAALAALFDIESTMQQISGQLETAAQSEAVGRAGICARLFTRLIAKLSALAGRAVRPGMRLRPGGFEAGHPKHLLPESADHHWYLEHLKADLLVLDLGCDRGGHARRAARVARAVVGIEREQAALLAARQAGEADYLRADLELPLPFRSDAFDCVLALDVIEHLDGRDEFLAEARRVLRERGLLLLSAPNSRTAWKRALARAGLSPLADPTHRIEYAERELRAVCERAGFEVLRVEPVVLDTPWARLIDLIGVLSIPLYRKGVQWKRARALSNPDQSTGFRLTLRKTAV